VIPQSKRGGALRYTRIAHRIVGADADSGLICTEPLAPADHLQPQGVPRHAMVVVPDWWSAVASALPCRLPTRTGRFAAIVAAPARATNSYDDRPCDAWRGIRSASTPRGILFLATNTLIVAWASSLGTASQRARVVVLKLAGS